MIQRFQEFHHSDCPPASVTRDVGNWPPRQLQHQNTTTSLCLLQRQHLWHWTQIQFGKRRICNPKHSYSDSNTSSDPVSPVSFCIVQHCPAGRDQSAGQSICQSPDLGWQTSPEGGNPGRGFWVMQPGEGSNAATLPWTTCVNKMRLVALYWD